MSNYGTYANLVKNMFSTKSRRVDPGPKILNKSGPGPKILDPTGSFLHRLYYKEYSYIYYQSSFRFTVVTNITLSSCEFSLDFLGSEF